VGRIKAREFELKDGRKGIIRCAEKGDAKRLLELFESIVSEDLYNVTCLEDVEKLNMTIEKEEQYIEDHQKQGKVVLVAEIDGCIVGMAGLENGQRQKISHVGNLHISVLKDFRSNGVGTQLINAVFDWAKEDPILEKIGLGVFANNKPAIGLYKKLGFIEEGRRVRAGRLCGQHLDV
jgi:RimJ/RimL family protein N-acetyltransferase